eukprot:114767-Hanusia_phi.AAC.1
MFSDHLAKKHKGLKLKPFQIKGHMWIFLNSLIENPAFDSQTKETLTLKPSAFGSKAEFDDKFFKKLLNGTKIIDGVLSFGQEKQEKDMKKTDGKKTGRIVGIPKLEDANDAGTKHAADCTLILTEGDSAKALAVSGLAVVGRNRYGVFPLRGKVANPRDANHEQIMKNEEIKNLKTILGLQQGNKYDNGPQGLRYGHVMIMADQDPDGSHIKGLLINLFHYYWPNLLRYPGFLQEFATPIVKAKKKSGGKNEIAFFTLQEYEEWREQVGDGLGGWTIKYYKGLGTSSSQEAKEYFSNLPLHQMDFAWEGAEDGEIIDMVFSKKRADDRKQWLLKYEEDLFVDHNGSEVTYSDFINKELIHFSMMDNMRSIPSLVDGWKPGQRKILFACFKRKLKTEIKVAQLAGYVAEHSAYHHGEQSLAMAIVGMAQNFVGSNNINVLVPSGQFGTRLQGGADAASPRYIFTHLHPITRFLFHEADDAILKYLSDDGQSIEPQWYVPILPTVLVNGAHGIGTGWSTDVPCYNPRDVVGNLKRLLRQEVMEPMHPWFRGFGGSVELNVSKKGEVSYTMVGRWEKVDETTLVVTELPVGKWTQQYKEFLESLMDTEGGKKEPFIKGYREYHTDTTVHFEVTMTEKRMEEAEELGIAKKFQLTRSLAISNMHLFNADGQIQRYDSPEQIMREFYGVRMEHYKRRKQQLEGELGRQLRVLDNKCRFIKEVIAGTLKVSNRKKAEIVQDLTARGYTPIHKEGKKKAAEGEETQEPEGEGEGEQEGKGSSGGYDYLLNMPILSLTLERVKHLQEERDEKAGELEELNKLTPADLWERDLDSFMAEYDRIEEEEEKRAKDKGPKAKASQGSKKAIKKQAAKKRRKSWGADSMSEDESDLSLDDSDEEFAAASKPKKPQARPAASSAPAAKPPPPAAKPAAPKAALKRGGTGEEKARQVKKQDLKDTPDKSAMVARKPLEEEDEDLPALSLMERLAAKMSDTSKISAPAAKPAKKQAKKVETSEESEAESEVVEEVKKKPTRGPVKSYKDESEDSDFDPEEEERPAKKAAAAKSSKKVKDDEDFDLSDSEDEVGVPQQKPKKKPVKKAEVAKPKEAAKKETKSSKKVKDDEDFDMSDSEDEVGVPQQKPKKKPVKKAEVAKPKEAAKKCAPKARKPKDDDSDDEFFDEEITKVSAPASRAGDRAPRRAAAAAKTYVIDSDEDSEVDMFDDSD